MDAYIVDLDYGRYSGPYPDLATANHAAEYVVNYQSWFIADATGHPHPELDPLVIADIVDAFAPFQPLSTLHLDN